MNIPYRHSCILRPCTSHLHTGSIPVVYLHLDHEIYELQTAAPRKHGSWFLNQRVNPDKHFYLASRMDARFLLLPYLEKAGTKFSPLDQIVTIASGCQRIPLAKAHTSWHLDAMCDVKDLGDGPEMIFYRYNEQKCLDWLKKKVEATAIVLAQQRRLRLAREQALCVSGFDAGTTMQVVDQESSESQPAAAAAVNVSKEETRVAVQIIMDYLSDSMTAKFLDVMGFSASDMQASRKQETKRKADWELEMELEAETLAYSMPSASGGGGGGSGSAGIASGTSTSTSAKKAAPARPNAASKFNGGKPVEAKKSIASFFGAKKA